MQIARQAPRTVTPTHAGIGQSRGSFLLRALNWLAERDRHYRDARTLRSMPDERLEDMGIDRQEIERVFSHL